MLFLTGRSREGVPCQLYTRGCIYLLFCGSALQKRLLVIHFARQMLSIVGIYRQQGCICIKGVLEIGMWGIMCRKSSAGQGAGYRHGCKG